MVQLGPGMYSSSRAHCGDCKGEGKTIEEKNKCKTCKGEKISKQKKDLEVTIEPGVFDGHDIVYTGEHDEYPGVMAGDLHIRIKVDPHPVFKRVGADLWVNKKITLLEALTGFYFEIEHLDKRKITVTTAPGDIISAGEKKVIIGKGMPFFNDRLSHGNLIIQFEIEFPKKNTLTKEYEALRKILPGPKQAPL